MSNIPVGGLAASPPFSGPILLAPAAQPDRASTQVTQNLTKDMAATPAKAGATAKPVTTPDDLQELVADIQRKVASFSPELQFSIDQKSGQPIVTMTDKTTNQVVWQFPSEEAMQVRKALDQFQRGTLLNHQV
jgi:uncharacterized FlaG/YvyC family protein